MMPSLASQESASSTAARDPSSWNSTLLLGKGANVNARDMHGNTPLAEAVQLGNLPLAMLLQHKADPSVRHR